MSCAWSFALRSIVSSARSCRAGGTPPDRKRWVHPRIAESGVRGYEFTAWAAALVPAGTPRNVVDKLYEGFSKALDTPDARKRFAEQGAEIVASSPDEFAKFFRAELDKWARVVRETGIKAD